MLFMGMQDHTADSIRSLEGFKVAWFEEAHNISQRSLELLIPTIREEDGELWFSWNPENEEDPIDRFLLPLATIEPQECIVVHSTYLDNPLCPEVMRKEAERLQRLDPVAYAHIWLGEYNKIPDAIVLHGKWRIEDFDPPAAGWDGPYFGADWGFARDPTVLIKCWIGAGRLWIEHEARGVGISLDATPELFSSVPGWDQHLIRGDSSRPETIHHLVSRGLSIVGAGKWPNSVKDGIAVLRSFEEIIIHPRCRGIADEARTWSYKTDRLTKDPLPILADGNDHGWDAVRYALEPLIKIAQKPKRQVRAWYPGMQEHENEDQRAARLLQEAVATIRKQGAA